jgi:N-acetyl sugar amidotransferase
MNDNFKSPLFEENMKYCVRCCMPETVEGQDLDDMQICKACRNSEEKMHIDWIEREKKLRNILEDVSQKAKGAYDCILPISGGKDSTFQMHVLCKVYGMKPLAVTFNHNWYSETGWYNLMNSLEQFNVDHVMFTPNRGLVNRLARKSLEELGDPCWHCHMGAGSFPLQIAVRFNIPFLVYGESSNESYSKGTYLKPVEYNREYFLKTSAKLTPEKMVNSKITAREVSALDLPTTEEYEKAGVWGIHLGNYIFWDEERQTQFVKDEYGWKEAGAGQTYKGYKSDECVMPSVHDFTCYLKRGFSRATFHASNDVRNGLLTREDGFDLVRRYEPVEAEALDYFLEISGLTRKQFYDIMKSHRMRQMKDVDVPVFSRHPSLQEGTVNPVRKQEITEGEPLLPFMQQLIRKHRKTNDTLFAEKFAKNGSSNDLTCFTKASVGQFMQGLKNGDISPRDIAAICINRFEKFENRYWAWEIFDKDKLLDQAKAIEKRLPNSYIRVLEGIPLAVKDMYNTADFPTQMGSPLWKNFTPGNDARTVFYCRKAGALIPGKTVTAEFAVDAVGKTLNPYDISKTPGTSSSGSAVAVATGMVPMALGSQTGGSIIRPASFCGIYGCKPSFGSISRTATLKTTDSLDTLGFFSYWVNDLRRLYEVLRVRGHNFPILHQAITDPKRNLKPEKRDWKVLVVNSHVWDQAEKYAQEALMQFAETIAGFGGFEVMNTPLPKSSENSHQVHKTIYDKCLSYYFAEEYKKSELISPVMNQRIENGLSITAKQYHAALKEQEKIARDLDEQLSNFDVFIALSTSSEAPLRDEIEKPDTCLMWTLAHLPVISAPVFKSPSGMPFGLQIGARRYSDYKLLQFVEHLADVGLIPKCSNQIPMA